MTQVINLQNISASIGKVLLSIGVGAIALVLIFPESFSVPITVVVIGMNVLLVWVAVNDFRTGRISNWVTYPLIAVGIVRSIVFRDLIFLLYWTMILSLWSMRFMGGGDAKLLMGLFALYPDFQLAQFVSASILVTGIPYLLYKYRHRWRTVPRALIWRLITRQFLPSQAEFESEAVPYAFSFCLGGAAYLLMHVVKL